MNAVLRVKILLPISEVSAFEFVTNWEKQSLWIPNTRIIEKKNAHQNGGYIIARTSLLGIGFNDRMVITDFRAPHICVISHKGMLIRGEGQFIVETLGGTSQFTWLEDVSRTVWWYRWLFMLTKPISKFFLGLSLRRLQRVIAYSPF